MNPPLLRPYQQDLQSRIFDAWRAGHRNVLATLATGGGKSLVLADTIRLFAQDNKTVLLVAHRKELVQQMALHIARQGVRHRIIGSKETLSFCISEQRAELSGQCFVNPSAQVAVASVDTVMSRMDHLKPWLKTVDLVVCDEAHHPAVDGNHTPNRKPNKWAAVFDECPNSLGLGVTATAQRADGKGLGRHADGVFDYMCVGLGTAELIGIKSLVEFEIFCPEGDFNLEQLKQGSDGDYTNASMKMASESSHIVGDVVEHYMRYSAGKRALVFATDVETSVKMAAQFNAAGIPAASISGMTDPGVRSDVLRRLRDGRISVVTNVDVCGEGLDIVAIDTVLLARPTASLAVYLQHVGRCLRPDPANPSKIATIIDAVSNVKRHGFPDRPRIWTLDRRQKRASKEPDPELVDVLVCPNTGRPYEAINVARCPHCFQADGVTPGNHTKPSGNPAMRAIEVVAGDLCKLSADDLAQLRAAMALPDPETAIDPNWSGGVQVGQRNIAMAKLQAQRELSHALAEWAGYQRGHYGRDDSEIYRRFYHATGMDMVTATGATQSRQDMIAMTERVRGWLTQPIAA